MNKSQRIFMDVNQDAVDKHIKINLKQNVKTLEILSMSIDTSEIYNRFNADYGMLIGRVYANNGAIIPNAKISIFIPIDEEDKTNKKIRSIYPYDSPRDKNSEGKRYNLLPRVSSFNKDGLLKPTQPFGSFPTKEEILVNESYLEVYEKYYKYSTVTNDSGDYMLFGVPIGVNTVHLSVDITDIGEYSMSPASMVTDLGYSPNLFTDENSKIKHSEDLADLPNIDTQEISVDIIPFWGDKENYEIGITRQDFRIRADINNTATIFGTIGTMGNKSTIGDPERDRGNRGFDMISNNTEENYDIRTLRGSDNLNIRVFTYLNNINEDDIEHDLSINIADNSFKTYTKYIENRKIDPTRDIVEIDKSEYFLYIKNGVFAINISCNRDKFIVDEIGEKRYVDDDHPMGTYSRFLGMIIIDYGDDVDVLPMEDKKSNYYGKDKAFLSRGKIKIPQNEYTLKHNEEDELKVFDENEKWRKKYFILEGGENHTIAQFFPTVNNDNNKYTNNLSNNNNIKDYLIGGLIFKTSGVDYLNKNNYGYVYDISNQVTERELTTTTGVTGDSNTFMTYSYEFPYNKKYTREYVNDGGTTETPRDGNKKNVVETYFGAQWINMFMILPQYTYSDTYTTYGQNRYKQVSTILFENEDYHDKNNYYLPYYEQHNNQEVFAGIRGSTNFVRADTFKTAIISIPKEHIILFGNHERRDINLGVGRDSKYDDIVSSSSYLMYTSHSNTNNKTYKTAYDVKNRGPFIFKGFYDNDCIRILSKLNLLQ